MNLCSIRPHRALKFGIAAEFARARGCEVADNSFLHRAREAFFSCPKKERQTICEAAKRAADFLLANDKNFRPSAGEWRVLLQSDLAQDRDDARDIVIRTPAGFETGISIKDYDNSIKRLHFSNWIDFRKWVGVPRSESNSSRERKTLDEESNAQNQRRFLPLRRFKREIAAACACSDVAANLWHRLFGRKDFYEVVKRDNYVAVRSFNWNGALGWGRRLRSPKRLRAAEIYGKNAILEACFSECWSLSFHPRVTQAVAPLPVFEVRLMGIPAKMSRHEILIEVPDIAGGKGIARAATSAKKSGARAHR